MYKEIADNKRKTVVIMALFLLLIGAMGWLLEQYTASSGLTYGVLIGGGVYAIISYYAGAKMAIAVNGAKQIVKKDNPRYWRVVENMAITNGMPLPKMYIIDDPSPNAFATGRDPKHAVVAVTSGLLEIMDDTELEGVIAHELGHIKNYDIRVSLIAFALTVMISLIADIMLRVTWFRDRDSDNNNQLFTILAIAGAILAPIVATMIQLAVSRKREYLADATGALTTRYPEGLARALEKIAKYGKPMSKQNSSTAHLFFANPLRKSSFSGLFSTHPPIEERVAKLRSMVG